MITPVKKKRKFKLEGLLSEMRKDKIHDEIKTGHKIGKRLDTE